MNLKSKLSRLQTETGRSLNAPQPPTRDSQLQRRLARIGAERLSVMPQNGQKTTEAALAYRLKGYAIAEGVIEIQCRIPLDGTLGRLPLALLRNPIRLPGENGQAYLRQVYIDTETTGLSGGSGTLAFLIGQAVVEQDALRVTQYLLTRFAGEAALLKAFANGLTTDDRLVSYNGKSYDLPLLTTRYRMQGQAYPFETMPHLDLLHPVRRLFARCWTDCRLMTLEQRLFGFQREDDLPGSEAPGAWFDYMKQGKAERVIRVVHHNRQDIVSLALAHAALAQAIERPEAHDVDIVALARWQSCFDKAEAYRLLCATGKPLNERGKRLLGQLARRSGDWKLAVRLWEELAERGCRDASEQLAKYHEHISRDLPVARHYCQQLPPGIGQTRRLKRIEEKQYQQAMQPSMEVTLSDNG